MDNQSTHLKWTESRVINPIAILVIGEVGHGCVHRTCSICCKVSHFTIYNKMTSVCVYEIFEEGFVDLVVMTLFRGYKKRRA